MTRHQLSVVLLYLPLSDPTSPYHSLVYLASFAKTQGFHDIVIRDTNIEALHYCSQPDFMNLLLTKQKIRRHRLAEKPYLSRQEQLEYGYLVKTTELLTAQTPRRAIAILQNEATFYDYSIYRTAVRDLKLWLDALSCEGFAGQFNGFALNANGFFNLSSVADLTDETVLHRAVGALREYYERELLPELQNQAVKVVGINITYTSQLPFALWLMRRIREILPQSYIVCGGTEVSDVWKYLSKQDLFPNLFRCADACVVGEGETAFVQILKSLAANVRPQNLPNVVFLDTENETYTPPKRIVYENLDALPTPNYALTTSDKYFSPHQFVYYSPTRGCYWNKCTFCDYGLNFGTPTSPWRQRSLDLILQDLREISKTIPFIYFSVDVLAPNSITKLAKAIVEAGINIRWSAEIRLEKYFNAERCKILRQSGCVAVSVGFESGCQRILDGIQKGTYLDEIEKTLQGFSTTGIAVQMMGFTDFPSETFDEANETIQYLKRNQAYWTVAGLGKFQLTPGAIIAQNPQNFGIETVCAIAGDDIQRVLTYDETNCTSKTQSQKTSIEQAKKDLSSIEFDRPFAGGIDSTHSIFYYSHYGAKFPRYVMHQLAEKSVVKTDSLILNGSLIFHEIYNLLQLFDDVSLAELHLATRHKKGVALDNVHLKVILQSEKDCAFPVDARNPYFVRSDGVMIPCSSEMFHILSQIDGKRTFEAIFTKIKPQNSIEKMMYELLRKAIIDLELVCPSCKNDEN